MDIERTKITRKLAETLNGYSTKDLSILLEALERRGVSEKDVGENAMVEVKIDPVTLPKDGQKVKWKTQDDIDEGTFKTGTYSAEDGLFLYDEKAPGEYTGWDTLWDVHQWISL